MTTERVLHRDEVEAALGRLLERGVLEAEQVDAVRLELAAQAVEVGAAEPAGHRRVGRLVAEIAAYLGAALVAASVVVFLGENWGDLTVPARLLMLGGSGVTAIAAGCAVALTTRGGRAALRQHDHAARRRVASVLLVLGSVLVAILVQQLSIWSDQVSGLVASLVCLALLAGAQALAPSAITEMGLLASTLLSVGLSVDLVVPEQQPMDYEQVPADVYAVTTSLVLVGLVWGALVARRLTLPVLAVALGCATALVAGFTLSSVASTSRLAGCGLLLLVVVVSVVAFLLDRAWPWLAATVIGLSLLVFVLVGQVGASALAFLAAGAALLVGSLLAAWLGRRTPDNLPSR